ncbi:hypothetical protein M0802_010343 [Mischocyttarus mexicanus]|nr:hypothetical protein M0802_010343 [Mischocyttarus mexicanus]
MSEPEQPNVAVNFLFEMRAALKRGVNYGLLDKKRGYYKLNSMGECDWGRELVNKPGKRRGTKMRLSTKKQQKQKQQKKNNKKKKKMIGQRGPGGKGKSRGRTRNRTDTRGGRCRCIATRGKNAYSLKSDIPIEQQEQLQKDVVCCYENKWKDNCDNVTESTDQSRSTLDSNPENTNDRIPNNTK